MAVAVAAGGEQDKERKTAQDKVRRWVVRVLQVIVVSSSSVIVVAAPRNPHESREREREEKLEEGGEGEFRNRWRWVMKS